MNNYFKIAKFFPRRNAKGFTLIEILISSAILAIFIGIAFSFISSIVGSTDTLVEKNEMIANQELVKKKLQWLMGQATNVTLPLPNTTGTSIRLTGASSAIFPALFSLTGDSISLSLASGPNVALTNNRMKISQFLIEHFSNSQSTSTVRVSVDIQSSIYSRIRATSTYYYALQQ